MTKDPGNHRDCDDRVNAEVKLAGGIEEDGIPVGNVYDKYGSRNPVVRWLMRGFEQSLEGLVARVGPRTIHEVGCGEGYWVLRWSRRGLHARGCDFSTQAIALARDNAVSAGVSAELFQVQSIYDVEADRDSADLVVCCEVLEHLEDPQAALRALQGIVTGHLIVSVPREPLWRMLNLARGKYVRALGNTPGHIQHWSSADFVRLLSQHFKVDEVRTPLPWTMLLCSPRD